jgi:hypothetical protein
MKMSPDDIVKYKKLAYYVRVNIPEILKVPGIVDLFRIIGQINNPTLRAALTWDKGPTIKIVDLRHKKRYGEFTGNVHSMEIRIDRSMVEEFEAGRGECVAPTGNVYLVGVALMHELMHWADDHDGICRTAEEVGDEFERALYGQQIGKAELKK